MIRKPLRPLARVIDARAKGENPDAIERENLRLRHEEMRDRDRNRRRERCTDGTGLEPCHEHRLLSILRSAVG